MGPVRLGSANKVVATWRILDKLILRYYLDSIGVAVASEVLGTPTHKGDEETMVEFYSRCRLACQ